MANESISSSASFYEPSLKYSEENTQLLYQHVKLNLQDIQKLTKDVNENMKERQKDMAVTVKLLNAIKTTDEEKNN